MEKQLPLRDLKKRFLYAVPKTVTFSLFSCFIQNIYILLEFFMCVCLAGKFIMKIHLFNALSEINSLNIRNVIIKIENMRFHKSKGQLEKRLIFLKSSFRCA